jgi:hypothetical protein
MARGSAFSDIGIWFVLRKGRNVSLISFSRKCLSKHLGRVQGSGSRAEGSEIRVKVLVLGFGVCSWG